MSNSSNNDFKIFQVAILNNINTVIQCFSLNYQNYEFFKVFKVPSFNRREKPPPEIKMMTNTVEAIPSN